MMRASVIGAMAWFACATDLEHGAIDSALTDDDQCTDGASDGAHCALKALQLKAAKGSQQVPAACTSGIVGQIRQMGESCIDTCPQMCGPLGDAVTAFLMKPDSQSIEDAVKPVVCGHQVDFTCAFNNMAKCKSLITQAATLGFKLPDSTSDMTAQCAGSLVQTESQTDTVEEVVDAQNATISPVCTNGMVGKIRAYGTSCIDSCQGMCGPLSSAINAFLTKGGAPAVRPVVCSHQSNFRCALTGSNWAKCAPLIKKAASFGFTLPNSVSALSKQCR